MKLEYLEEFLALARADSYSAAAEELFVSVSTLSRHIILLEEELGVELFTRGPRTVSLNKAGELLYPYAETIVNAKESFDRALSAEQHHDEPSLSIGFSRAAIKYGILDVLDAFQKVYPGLSFGFAQGSPTHLLQMLRREECSFSISYKYLFHSGGDYVSVPLITDTLAVAVSRDNPLSRRETLTAQDLRGEHFIIHDKSSPTYKRHQALLRSAGVNLSRVTQAESTEFIIDLVAHGMGISLVQKRRFAGKLPENVALIPLVPDVEQVLVLTYRKHKFSEEEEIFFRFIRENFR